MSIKKIIYLVIKISQKWDSYAGKERMLKFFLNSFIEILVYL